MNMARLFSLISKVESNYNQYAVRFEEEMYQKLKNSRSIEAITRKCIINNKFLSEQTVCSILATSYGMTQLLGYNIYMMNEKFTHLRFKNILFIFDSYLTNIEIQFLFFKEFIKNVIKFDEDVLIQILQKNTTDIQLDETLYLEAFAKRYNGNARYAQKLKQNYHAEIYNELLEKHKVKLK